MKNQTETAIPNPQSQIEPSTIEQWAIQRGVDINQPNTDEPLNNMLLFSGEFGVMKMIGAIK